MPPIPQQQRELPRTEKNSFSTSSEQHHGPRNRRVKVLHSLKTAVVYTGALAFATWFWIGHRYYFHLDDIITPTPEIPFKWSGITPSSNLVWYPCFDNLECARLQVPLDWTSASDRRTVAIALTKVPAAVPETDNDFLGPVLLNPGGPGGSGVALVTELGRDIQMVVGRRHSVIGFDPRGINNTTPQTNCFPNEAARKIWWLRSQGTTGADLGVQFAMAKSIGKQCEEGVKEGAAVYAGTPNVARDMLAIVDASWKALGKTEKRGLRYWGFSYGTTLGQTFASMFPDRVERMVLDGVVDLDDYYQGGWLTNLQDTDKVIQSFYDYCSSTNSCALTEATPNLVARRLKKIMTKVRHEPVPVYGSSPDWITENDLRTVIFTMIYNPIKTFPKTAEAFAAIENGDASLVAALIRLPNEDTCAVDVSKPNTGGEAGAAVLCQDGSGRSNATLKDMVHYLEELKGQCELISRNWVGIQMNCVGLTSPARGLVADKGRKWGAETRNPILFVSTQYDPVTPLRNAEKAQLLFPGAGLLVQNSEGHCSISAPSACSANYIGRYFEDGKVVDTNTTVCEADLKP
ncbi:TAP-like protein-domain-containing protein, partial [Pyronema omphalodes]